MLIGLTGGIGAGKSTALNELKRMGENVIDADDVVHRLYENAGSEIVKELCRRYGRKIIGPGSKIDRRELARIVFKDENELNWLNSVVHPYVWEAIKERGEKIDGKLFCAVPLLFEVGWNKYMDCTVSVWCDAVTQRRRLLAKGMSDAQIAVRQNAQLPMVEKNERAEFVVVNSSSMPILQQQLQLLLRSTRLAYERRV